LTIRDIREGDIEAVIELFRKNYGDDYAIPEFYDPQWVKRGIYSDHIIWLVDEQDGRIVASGACILNYGDYNDQIGEIGRLVVDPEVGGRGLGRSMLTALVDASDERVEFAFAEARTVHPRTQKIDDRIGLVALGFLPMYYRFGWRESLVLSGQLFGNGRTLRRPGSAEVIPAVAPLAELSLRNLELDEKITVRQNVRAYPHDDGLTVAPLTGASLVRLLRIEQGRVVEPEVFGGMQIDQGLSQLATRKGTYLVSTDGDRTLGAVGYFHDEHNHSVRITELIALDEAVKGSLLRLAVEEAEGKHEAEMIKCDVDGASPRIQQTLIELGFQPAAYVPGMVFHHTVRHDVVRFMKLNVPWDLGPMVLTEPSQRYAGVVLPAFERANAGRECKRLAVGAGLMSSFSPMEVEFFQHVCEESRPAAGESLALDCLHLVLAGSVTAGNRSLTAGDYLGAGALMGDSQPQTAVAGEGARLLTLDAAGLARLSESHPRLALKLYQKLVANRAL
jgi:RimJ/RimL family protein N-acetyltransferase/CRP-like cAMP-binding protein